MRMQAEYFLRIDAANRAAEIQTTLTIEQRRSIEPFVSPSLSLSLSLSSSEHATCASAVTFAVPA